MDTETWVGRARPGASPTLGLRAHELLADVWLRGLGDENQHFVAVLEPRLCSGHDEAVVTDDSDDGRLSGDTQRGDRAADGGGLGRQGDLDEVGGAAFELEEPHQ